MKKFLIFSLVLMLCLTTFIIPSYATEVPSVDTFIEQYGEYHYSYVITQLTDGRYYIQFNYDNGGLHTSEGCEFYTVNNGNYITTYFRNSDNVNRQFSSVGQIYNSSTGKWGSHSRGDNHYDFSSELGTGVKASTVDIYDGSTGDLFFQVPSAGLAEAIMKVVKAEMPEIQTNLAQTMKTIVLCGVGCLALLIGLVLLVKVLRRYLPR